MKRIAIGCVAIALVGGSSFADDGDLPSSVWKYWDSEDKFVSPKRLPKHYFRDLFDLPIGAGSRKVAEIFEKADRSIRNGGLRFRPPEMRPDRGDDGRLFFVGVRGEVAMGFPAPEVYRPELFRSENRIQYSASVIEGEFHFEDLPAKGRKVWGVFTEPEYRVITAALFESLKADVMGGPAVIANGYQAVSVANKATRAVDVVGAIGGDAYTVTLAFRDPGGKRFGGVTVWDGQTVALVRKMDPKKTQLTFLTAWIVNPFGERVNKPIRKATQ